MNEIKPDFGLIVQHRPTWLDYVCALAMIAFISGVPLLIVVKAVA